MRRLHWRHVVSPGTPGLLSIERFALNSFWPPHASKVMAGPMLKAELPRLATDEGLTGTPNPVRLPKCLN